MRMDNFFFTIVSPEEITRPKPSRVQRLERACANCRKSKKRCGSERPCQRCVRTGRGDCCSSESPSSSSDLLPLDVTLPTVETPFNTHDHHEHSHNHDGHSHPHGGHVHYEHHERSSIVFGMSPFYTPSFSSGPSSPSSSLCSSSFASPSFNPSFMTRPVSSLSSVSSLLNNPSTPYETHPSNGNHFNNNNDDFGHNEGGFSTSSSTTSLRCSTGETFSVDIDSILATTDKKKEAAGLDQTTSASSSAFSSTPSTFCEIHDSVSPSSPFAASSRSHFASSSLSYSVASLGSTSLSVTSASSILTTSPVCSPSAASTCSMFTSFSNVAFSNSFSTSSSSN